MGRAPPKPFLSEKHYCCASSLRRPRGRRPAPSSRPCGLRRGTLSKLFPRYEICLARNLPNGPSFIPRPGSFPSHLSSLPFVAGGLAEGGHEGDPGGGGQRDHAQPARLRQPREAADAQATYHRRPARRRGRLHVPAQHEPHEESGKWKSKQARMEREGSVIWRAPPACSCPVGDDERDGGLAHAACETHHCPPPSLFFPLHRQHPPPRYCGSGLFLFASRITAPPSLAPSFGGRDDAVFVSIFFAAREGREGRKERDEEGGREGRHPPSKRRGRKEFIHHGMNHFI